MGDSTHVRPMLLYMNNVGWGGRWSDKQLSRKCIFILTPKHIATSVLWFKFRIKTIKLDEKATLRNRYNPVPYPALDTKWERKTYNLDGIK